MSGDHLRISALPHHVEERTIVPAISQCPVPLFLVSLFVAVAQHTPCAVREGWLRRSADSARQTPATCTGEVGQ